MTRYFRPILVATLLVLTASPALAQKKLKGVPAGGGTVYGPVYGGSARDRDDDRDDRDDDRDDDDRWEDRDGPGRHGRGHAYGHYSKDEKETRKRLAKEQKRMQRGDMCLDADRNGVCDVAQRRSPNECVYVAGTRRCADVIATSRYPATLPEMMSAVIAARGQRSIEASRWLENRPAQVRMLRAPDGRLAQASWYDGSGTLLQRWIDRDLDGDADAVQLYRNGQFVRTISR